MDVQIVKGPGKRLTPDRKAAETGAMTDDQFELILAIEDYKKSRRQTYISATQILEVMLFLGYRKIAPQGEYRLDRNKENNLQSGLKQCNLCKKTLSLDSFAVDKKSKDGTKGSCKACKLLTDQLKSTKQRISKHLQAKGDSIGMPQQNSNEEVYFGEIGVNEATPENRENI